MDILNLDLFNFFYQQIKIFHKDIYFFILFCFCEYNNKLKGIDKTEQTDRNLAYIYTSNLFRKII